MIDSLVFVTWLIVDVVATRFTFELHVSCVWVVYLFGWLVVGL